MPIRPLHSNVPFSNLSSLSLLTVFFLFLKTSCSFRPWHCSLFIFLRITPEFPIWLIPFSAPSYLKFKPRLPSPLSYREPQCTDFFPCSRLQTRRTGDSQIYGSRPAPCSRFIPMFLTDHWSFSLETLPSVSDSTLSRWACPLPHKSQFPFPVPSFGPTVLVSKSFPPQTLKSSPKCLSCLSLLTWRFSPSCWIRHFCWFLSSKLLLPPCVFIIKEFGHLLYLPASSSGCPFPSASLITYWNDVPHHFPTSGLRPSHIVYCSL